MGRNSKKPTYIISSDTKITALPNDDTPLIHPKTKRHVHAKKFNEARKTNKNKILHVTEDSFVPENYPYQSYCTKPHLFSVKNDLVSPRVMYDNCCSVVDFMKTIEKDVTIKEFEVIDVSKEAAREMKYKNLVRYFQSRNRLQILNQVNYEFSHTKLANHFKRPKFVDDVDWIDHAWGEKTDEEKKNTLYPRIQNYILTSSKGSYMDFHIDMSGSSVWYHVILGKKVVCLVEPTETNLSIFKSYYKSDGINPVFFLDHDLEPGTIYFVEVNPGETL
jgi:hypothetical protein